MTPDLFPGARWIEVDRGSSGQQMVSVSLVSRIVFYLAAEATFATGSGLNLDGGTTATLPPMVR